MSICKTTLRMCAICQKVSIPLHIHKWPNTHSRWLGVCNIAWHATLSCCKIGAHYTIQYANWKTLVRRLCSHPSVRDAGGADGEECQWWDAANAGWVICWPGHPASRHVEGEPCFWRGRAGWDFGRQRLIWQPRRLTWPGWEKMIRWLARVKVISRL